VTFSITISYGKFLTKRGCRTAYCDICNIIEFRNPITHALHIRKTHTTLSENDFFICDQCGRKFCSYGELANHAVVHLTKRTWQCEICPRTFKNKRGLKLHQIIHAPKSFECHLCGKFYRSRNTIRIHMMEVHTKPEDGYKCPICTKSYIRSEDRDVHVKTHRTKHSTCEICLKTFGSENSLRFHRERVHELLCYECYVCRQVISKFFVMIYSSHDSFYPFSFRQCAQGYN
jgi:general transcription factor IIIA